MTPGGTGIGGVVATVRDDLRRRLWIAGACWGGVTVAVVLLASWLLAGADGWGQGTPWPALLDFALVSGLLGGLWFIRRLFAEHLSDRALSTTIEDASGLARGTVLGSLELERGLPVGVSRSLAFRAEEGVVRELTREKKPLGGHVGRNATMWSRYGGGALAVLLPCVLAIVVFTPDRAATAVAGLGRPLALLTGPALPPLAVAPGDIEVRRGSDALIHVTAEFRDSVTLRWQAAGDVARSTTHGVTSNVASFSLSDVQAPIRYRATAPDGAESSEFTVTPVDPLFVTDVTLALTFPSHTGRFDEEYSGDIPPLSVPSGTRIAITGSASRPLGAAALRDESGSAVVAIDVADASFSGDWVPRSSGTFTWAFVGTDGEDAELAPFPLTLEVVRDAAPEVRFTFPARDTVLPLTLRQPLAIEAMDDYGLAALELIAYRVTSLGERQEPRIQGLNVGESRDLLVRPLMDLSAWELLPGDTVRYYAQVRDNAPLGQVTRTPEYILRMPDAAEIREETEDRLNAAADRMDELADRAAEAEEETRTLERQAEAQQDRNERENPLRNPATEGEQVAFDQREDVRRALEEQTALQAEVDSLRRELEEMSEALRQAGMSDMELRSDLDELQEMMEQMVSNEDREQLEEMLRDLDQQNPAEAQQTLEELQERQEEFRRQIEESIEQFKRAAVEQDFRATTSEAEELAEQEQALADAMREGDDPELRAEQQEELLDRTEEMEAGMEQLEQRLQELGESEAADAVREAREQSASARESMQQAGQQARQQQSQQAGDQADQASQDLQDAAQQLQQAQQDMANQQAEELAQALRQASEDALTLAREQSDVRERMRGANRQEIADLRADVAAVEQGARNLAENLAVTTQTQGAGNQDLEAQLGEAIRSLDQTVQAMENQPGAPSPQSAASTSIDALNQVALLAAAGAQQASEGGQGQSQQSAQGDMQQQLEQLAQDQGQLNVSAGQVMPMQLGQQAMQQQMEQLANRQQSVGEQLEELAQRPESEGDGQPLGDLEALAREAMALAQELAGSRLDPETRQRQEQLFHRLLDAGRSLEQEEFSEERESEEPGTFTRGEVLPLGPEALGALRYQLPSADDLRRMTPAERQLVIFYFERLNQRRGSGSPVGGSTQPSRNP